MRNPTIFFALVLSALFLGCDDESTDGRGYRPPAGLGSVLVENDTMKDWNVSVDGDQLGRVGDGTFLTVDRKPGDAKVHLDEHEGSDEKDVEVSVTEGTVVVVRISEEGSRYDIDTVRLGP